MRKILVVGIGAGDPDYITIQAIKALNRADVLFIPDKGSEKAGLRQLRLEICERYVERKPYRSVDVPVPARAPQPADYQATVADWHATIAARYAALFRDELAEGQCGALLVWGDPALYDSTLRILDAIRAGGMALDVEVVPGISSVQALAARHRIALNRIGEPVLLTTGRRLEAALPLETSTVVLLDGEQGVSRASPIPTPRSSGVPTSARRTKSSWPAGSRTCGRRYRPCARARSAIRVGSWIPICCARPTHHRKRPGAPPEGTTMKIDLTGKTAVVTGSTEGIGWACAAGTGGSRRRRDPQRARRQQARQGFGSTAGEGAVGLPGAPSPPTSARRRAAPRSPPPCRRPTSSSTTSGSSAPSPSSISRTRSGSASSRST